MTVDEAAVDLEEAFMDLSKVGKTIDGEGFTYFQLDCVRKRVGSIKLLEEYEHLRQIDLSGNLVEDVTPLGALVNLLKVDLSDNAIPSIDMLEQGMLPHLLHLNISGNHLTSLPPLRMPQLKTAHFARNQIVTCNGFEGHLKLELLNLDENKLQALNGIQNMPKLKTLKVRSNSLTNAHGIVALEALEILDLSKNHLETLDGSWEHMQGVASVDVSGNQIATVQALEGLTSLPRLRRVGFSENPLGEEENTNIRHEVLICNWGVEVIDGEEVTEDERGEAKAINEERLEKSRLKRLEEEDEVARAAAEAAAE